MSEQSANSVTQKYWHGLSWVIFAVFFRIVFGIGSSIIFVRYLGDTGYGAVVVMADFVTLAIVLLSMGLGVAQTRILPQLFVQKEYGKAKDVIIKTFSVRIVLSIVVVLVLYKYTPLLVDHVYHGIPEALLKIAYVLIPVQMVVFCLRGTLEVTFHQKEVSLGSIRALVVRLGCVVPVILLDLGIVWFLFTQLLADLYLLVVYGRCFIKQVWHKVRKVNRQRYRGKLYSLGFIMMLTLLSNRFLGKEMDTQILSFRLHETGLAEVAVYSISFMLVLRSLSFIGVGSGSASNLSQSMISELVESKNVKAISSMYTCQLQVFYFIAIPLIAGSFLFAEAFLILMYGESFAGSGRVCTVLFLGVGGTVINYINSPMLYGFGKERLLLGSRAFFGVLNVVLSYILAAEGAFGVAAATGICLLGIALYESSVVRNLVRIHFPWTFFAKVILGSLLMVVTTSCFFFFFPPASSIINILVGIIAGGGIFMLIMVLLKPLDKQISENFSGLPKIVRPMITCLVK